MEFRIGRNEDNEIVIRNHSVSRYHGIIKITEGKIIYEDLNSSNGSYINGNRISGSIEINEKDIIKVGTELIPWKNYLNENSNDKNKIKENNEVLINISESTETNINKEIHAQTLIESQEEKEKNKTSNGFGIAGFVLSLLGFLTSPFLILSILGLIFSWIGIYKKPKRLAIAGLTISILGLIIGIIILFAVIKNIDTPY